MAFGARIASTQQTDTTVKSSVITTLLCDRPAILVIDMFMLKKSLIRLEIHYFRNTG
jgi:hypothetical protein